MIWLWNEILYRPLFNILILIYDFLPDIGIAIIILTIITRLILYPFQSKALRAQRELQELQPELQKIQKKYKDDKQKQSKAVMAFYQTNKVNPFSSCLIQLVQFPIIIALYQVFRTGLDVEKLTQLYTFIPRPEIIDPNFLGYFNLAEPNKFILPILAGITQFFYSKMMMPQTPKNKKGPASTQEIISRQMIYFMPLMIVFFAMKLPAALPLYWIVVALFGILQYYLIGREKFSKKKVKIKVRPKPKAPLRRKKK